MTETHEPSTTDGQQSAPAPGPAPDRAQFRSFEQLRRSVTDRKIAGVAGGLGRHFNIDPTILRVLFVVLCFFGGAGFLLYGVAWLLVPEDGQHTGNLAMRPGTRNAVLIGAGIVATLLLLGDSWDGIGFPGPLLLVGIGVPVYLVFRDRGSTPQQPTHPDPAVGTAYGPQYGPQYNPLAAEPTGTDYAQAPPPWMPPTPGAPAPQPPRPKRGPKLFGFTLALVAVALGTLGLYDVSGGDVLASAYPALALAVVGLMLVVGAFVGRAGGLVLLGIVAAVALAITSVVDSGVGRGDDRLNATPLSTSELKPTYYVESGRVVLDLSEISNPEDLAGRSIEVGARAGELLVVLPEGVRTDIDADIDGPGQIDLPEHSSGGIDNRISETYGSGPGTLELRAHLFAGHIDVRTN